jgi:hypothetical protein
MAHSYEPKPITRRRNADWSPITLYRYFSPNKLETFLRGRLGLTPPKFLNDPLEFAVSRIPPDRQEAESIFDSFTADEFQMLRQAGQTQLSFDQFKKLKEPYREPWISRILSQDYQNENFEYMRENLSQFWGVICLSEFADNSPMWTHYTKEYEGFVAEFVCQWEHLSHQPQARALPFGVAFKVEYSQDRPLFNRTFSNAPECLCIKETNWSYEHEWRIVRLLASAEIADGGRQFTRYPPASLKRIIVGNRMSQPMKDDVRTFVKAQPFSHVEVQQAVPNLAKRTIAFEPL